MKVERLSLRNFRNIGDTTFHPNERINFLIGANGQGKTSFLEGLSYLGTLRSFRGAKNEEVVAWGESESEVDCTISPDEPEADPALRWSAELRVAFQKTTPDASRVSKVAFINGKPFRSATQYLSHRFGNFELGFHTVVFNPSDHDLLRGEPALRRSYLDRVLAAENVEHLKAVQRYQRVLEQRNALLRADPPPPSALLRGFTEPLCQTGAQIALMRLGWLERLSKKLNEIALRIAPKQLALKALYHSGWVPEITDLSRNNKKLGPPHFSGQRDLPSLELLEQSFWMQLSVMEHAEVGARTSLVGPHRDDWMFYSGDRILKGHGSQGEVRSALLALKLAEIELFQEQTGHRPILLLDDFSSELDRERRDFLLRYLEETGLQVFITTTEATAYPGKYFGVVEGQLNSLN